MPNDTDSVMGLIEDPSSDAVAPYPDAPDNASGDVQAAGSLLFDEPAHDERSYDELAFDDQVYAEESFGDEGFDEEFADFDADLPAIGPLEGGVVVLDDPDRSRRYAQARQRRMSRYERRRRVKLQARRVRRIVRHIEPWSVLKISLFFYACLWLIFLVSGVMVWRVLETSGTVESFEELVTNFFVTDGEPFTLDSDQVFRAYAVIGLVLSIAGATFNVLMVLLFNLLSDLTGGLRITMIEEETARPTPPKKRRRARKRRVPPPR